MTHYSECNLLRPEVGKEWNPIVILMVGEAIKDLTIYGWCWKTIYNSVSVGGTLKTVGRSYPSSCDFFLEKPWAQSFICVLSEDLNSDVVNLSVRSKGRHSTYKSNQQTWIISANIYTHYWLSDAFV